MGLSPALLTAYGADAALVAWAPTITGASFGGVSGFISGGPSEGLKQAVAWSHLVGAIGVAFWDGVKGEQGSVGQGAWNASQTALIAGAVGLGVTAVGRGGKWAYQALGKKPGELVPVKGPVNSPSSHFKSNISAATEAAQRAKAQQYLADFSSSVKKLARAQNEGASSEAVSALKAEVRNRAGLVNESWHAKHYLKYRGGGAEQKEFNEAVTMVYKGVVKGLRKRLEAMGYDTSKIKIKPIRNASSADSVGMDFDLEVSIKRGTGPLVVDGRIVSDMRLMRIAQREANILYGKATGGGCAEKAGMLITNRANAESFWELKVLQNLKKLDWSQVSDEKMPNVGEVTNFKINEATNETARSALGNVQEAVRTSHKDLPKLIGYAKNKFGDIKDPASKAKLHNVIAKLERLEAPMKRAGQSGDLAVVRQAMMEIRLQCGDKPVLEVMRDINGLYEFLSKIKP